MNDTLIAVATIVLVVGLLMIGLSRHGAHDERLRQLARRQVEIDSKLGAIMAHLGVVAPEPRYPEVERLLAEGDLVRAVKAYRDETGAGLKEAKDAVEEIAHRRGTPLR